MDINIRLRVSHRTDAVPRVLWLQHRSGVGGRASWDGGFAVAQVRSWCLGQDLVAGTVRAINLENMVEEELAGFDYGLAVLVGGVGEGSGMPGLPLDEWCPRDTTPS